MKKQKVCMTDELVVNSFRSIFRRQKSIKVSARLDFNNDKHKPALRAEADGILFAS